MSCFHCRVFKLWIDFFCLNKYVQSTTHMCTRRNAEHSSWKQTLYCSATDHYVPWSSLFLQFMWLVPAVGLHLISVWRHHIFRIMYFSLCCAKDAFQCGVLFKVIRIVLQWKKWIMSVINWWCFWSKVAHVVC